jgi:branched-chain amino acid aminotransferase
MLSVMLSGVVSVNGRITTAADAVVPVFDHGFLYGEGVYETLRTYRRKPFEFGAHMARLRRSAELIELPVPLSDAELRAEVDRTAAACEGPADGELYIRLLLTRGVGDLSYSVTATPEPSLVVIIKPLTPFPAASYTTGIKVAFVDIRRNHTNALNPLIKSNNLLNNALAMQEAYRRGAEEAIMLNQAGMVTECSQSNIFIVTGSALATPPLAAGLLPGITRQVVLELARALGIPGGERELSAADVLAADEAFITSTTRELTPVASIDDVPVGNGVPGPVTLSLIAAFRART